MELLAKGARLIDAPTGAVLTGDELDERIGGIADRLRALPPGVLLQRIGLDMPSVLTYLAAWQARRPVALLDPALPIDALVSTFRPAAVTDGWSIVEQPGGGAPTHPDLGVLLATSGSTGDPKLVRLSWHAVHNNAIAIAEALELTARDVAPTSLPLFYSYGMSVLNSHLAAGATVVVVEGGVLSKEFWTAVDAHGATSLAGVPHHYEMLTRIRWKPSRHPSLRALTQAGGRMRAELISVLSEQIPLFVMYGQTEAGPRMTTLPPSRLPEKLGSVGPAIPGGALMISPAGEVVYSGPNVMMGYAESAADLVRGDDLGGVLHTGDLGELDDEGYLTITGRHKRIGKVFGVRVNLDDLERMVSEHGPVAAVAAGDRIAVFREDNSVDVARILAERTKVNRSGFELRVVERLPLLPNGKVDYRALEQATT